MRRLKYGKYEYRRNLPHIEKAGRPHFMTFRTRNRFRLPPEAWLDESFDHVLRSDEKLADRIEYVWLNPVRHRQARVPWEYRWVWHDGLPIPAFSC